MRHATILCVTLAASATLSLASGCYRHRFYDSKATAQPYPASSEWHHHFLWGLINASSDVAIEEICPTGAAEIQSWIGPLQAILSYLTVGIYTPTTVRVFCRADAFVDDVRIERGAIDAMRARFPDLRQRLQAVVRDAGGSTAVVVAK